MAPIRPSTKTKRTLSVAGSKAQTSYPGRSTGSAFSSSKRDKRLVKQSVFLSKIEDAGVKKNKRRRPAKKLVGNMDSLEDALIEVEEKQASNEKLGTLKTLKGGRGEAKRREKLVKEERERFGKNLAILSQSARAKESTPGTGSNRWAALRAHIQANAPDKPEEG